MTPNSDYALEWGVLRSILGPPNSGAGNISNGVTYWGPLNRRAEIGISSPNPLRDFWWWRLGYDDTELHIGSFSELLEKLNAYLVDWEKRR